MLHKANRLPASEIPLVMKRGRRVVGDGVTLIYIKRKMDSGSMAGMTPRISFIVSTKVDKRATVRNRVRRLLSEAVRQHMGEIPAGADGVFMANKSLVGIDQKEVERRVIELVKKIK